MNYYEQQHYSHDPMATHPGSTINMADYMNENLASPQYYQENSNSNNSNSNPSPPLGLGGGSSEYHQQHAPYAIPVPKLDEKSSKKGYVIQANNKLQLTHGPPKYTKKRGPFSDAGGGPSAHDKAIIGQYRKEMRKEDQYQQHQSPMSLPVPVSSFGGGAGPPEQQHGNGNASGKKPKKPSPFQRAKSELAKRLQEKGDHIKKKRQQKTEVDQAKLTRKQKRIERNKIQTQVTSKGQPLMKGRIMNLLSKIEEQQQHNNV